MRKIIIIAVTLISIISCQKEEVTPTKPISVGLKCNCGLVVSDNVTDYSVVIRNSCSGNEKKFILKEGDWMNAHPGSDYCITNVSNW